MPIIRADLANTGGNFELKEPGTYVASIFGFKPGESNGAKTKGATTLNVRYKLDDGGSVFDTLIVHPSTMWKLKQVATSAGVPADDLNSPNAVIGFRHEFDGADLTDEEVPVYLDDLIEAMTGAQVLVVVEKQGPRTNPETGEIYPARNSVKQVKPLDGSATGGTDTWAGI